ncbi:hypothetical protein BC831DRAFT_515853 [Entophlyctis helioformis]|nr:hypothetical protein BC831DRAFT_515853 [Entophlyctis helioformis]
MSLVKRVKLWVYKYELTLGLYMLEPWEKTAFNSIVLLFSLFFVYTCYRWLPSYTSYVVAKSQYYFE